MTLERAPSKREAASDSLRFGLFDRADPLPSSYWTDLAPGTTAVEIEIGPGDGRFLLEAARAEPSTLFVGIETRVSSVARTTARGLPSNARVLHLDARFVVEHVLADESIDAYHLYFPDPWWKKRHAKRRLVTPSFARAVVRTLKPRGALYLITDVETRYREMTEVLAETILVEETWERSPSDPAQSSYERKYRTQGRRLCGARFRKI
jgi:tRNA (guanine-N7-)-methyltransferase